MKKNIINIALLSLGILGANVANAADARGFYAGAFGGAGRSADSTLTQSTTVDAVDFLLPVDVSGDTKNATFGIVGITAGHEWASSNKFKPALEVEGFYFWGDQKANLSNKNRENASVGDEYVAAGDHTFTNSFDMKSFALMLNGVVSFDTETMFTPYAGAGIGFAKVNLNNGNSIQTCKKLKGEGSCGVESIGGVVVNHFNTDDNASDNVFAAQAKLGLRASLSKNLSAFAEYRYLRLNSASYTFGNTDYVGHFATGNWKVESDSMSFNYGTAGVQYAF